MQNNAFVKLFFPLLTIHTVINYSCNNEPPPRSPCTDYQLPVTRERIDDKRSKIEVSAELESEIAAIRKQVDAKLDPRLLVVIENTARKYENTILCMDPEFRDQCNGFLATICMLHDFSTQDKTDKQLKNKLLEAIDEFLGYLKSYREKNDQQIKNSADLSSEIVLGIERGLNSLNAIRNSIRTEEHKIIMESLDDKLDIIKKHLSEAVNMEEPHKSRKLNAILVKLNGISIDINSFIDQVNR